MAPAIAPSHRSPFDPTYGFTAPDQLLRVPALPAAQPMQVQHQPVTVTRDR
ncbi:hypothetical protein [Streptomyces sp. NPDC048565]|uniref:hypothetical protein n=1 Tax=Streptomyces sp. NPDC048565 TaxID=3155266 RepID=UPI00342186FC